MNRSGQDARQRGVATSTGTTLGAGPSVLFGLSLSVMLGLAGCQPGATPEDGGVRLVEGERSVPGFPEARLSIEAPEPGTVVRDTTVRAVLELEGFELGSPTPGADARGIALSEKGQHVHFIVDDEPYVALYDLRDPVSVSGLEDGLHLIRAFASRQWHESVKSEGAYASTHFWVRDTAARAEFDAEAPRLTYSRPKGEYGGAAADSVMVDFYLKGVELSPEGHTVRLVVDDTIEHSITSWKPHYLVGLSEGEHSVRLELLGPDGSPVPGPFNSTERVITVSRQAASEGGQGDD